MAEKKKAEKEKPLHKMTAIELRVIAKEIAGVTGVHGMNKEDLLSAIKKAKGIEEAPRKKGDAGNRELKARIKSLKILKANAAQAEDKTKVVIYRRKIAKLKKQTRRAA